MKKQSSKLESTRKTEQDRPLSEILTFGQRSTQKVKVNWSKVKFNEYNVRVGFGFSGSVTDRAAKTLTHPDDVAMTWTRADMDVDVLAWLLTLSDNVIW